MRHPDPCEQLDIMDETYITRTEIWRLLPISKRMANAIFDEIRCELTDMRMTMIPGRVPRDLVLRKYPLDRKGIERAAKRKSATV